MKNKINLPIYDSQKVFPIEMKFSQSFHADFKKTTRQGAVVYCGEGLNSNKPVPAIPWYTL